MPLTILHMSQTDPVDTVEGEYVDLEELTDEDEGVEMEDGVDNRLAYWSWTGEEEDNEWNDEDIVLRLNLTEDQEEEEDWV